MRIFRLQLVVLQILLFHCLTASSFNPKILAWAAKNIAFPGNKKPEAKPPRDSNQKSSSSSSTSSTVNNNVMKDNTPRASAVAAAAAASTSPKESATVPTTTIEDSSYPLTLYCKAGPQGIESGDCPFSQSIRMVLTELDIKYKLQPLTKDNKPAWLKEEHGGRLPALKHLPNDNDGDEECKVLTQLDAVLKYLLTTFDTNKSLTNVDIEKLNLNPMEIKELYPTLSRYFKYSWMDKEGAFRRKYVCQALQSLEDHLSTDTTAASGPYWCGDQFTVMDCILAPKLYHLQSGLKLFKNNEIAIAKDYPALAAYMQHLFERPSFQQTSYPEAYVEWGWTGARNSLANYESQMPDVSSYFPG